MGVKGVDQNYVFVFVLLLFAGAVSLVLRVIGVNRFDIFSYLLAGCE